MNASFHSAAIVLVGALCAGCYSGPGGAISTAPPNAWLSPTAATTAPAVVYEPATASLAPPASRPYPPPPRMIGPELGPAGIPSADVSALQQQNEQTQALLTDLRTRIDQLRGELNQYEADLRAARTESAAAQQSVSALSTEMDAWRRELALVRTALHEQREADLRSLDEVNQTLQELLGTVEPPRANDNATAAAPLPGDDVAHDVFAITEPDARTTP